MIDWGQDEPKCPYCGETLFDPAEIPIELDHDGDCTDVECECGRTIQVWISVSYTFGVEEKTCKP